MIKNQELIVGYKVALGLGLVAVTLSVISLAVYMCSG